MGAVIVCDFGTEVLTGSHLRSFMESDPSYAQKLNAARVEWVTVRGAIGEEKTRCIKLAQTLADVVSAEERRVAPASALRIALQCGGSDAFSGISANPLIGAVAQTLITHGGMAVQAETDELMGAEAYFLRRVADRRVAESFLALLARFRARLEAHGESAEGNPSAGNNYRGLYNIALKSVGAGMKKAPEVRLDGVGEYAELLEGRGRGFFFMDSPGNDLESVAGQVAAGCQVIFFTTGNGAVTNHPFRPDSQGCHDIGTLRIDARPL